MCGAIPIVIGFDDTVIGWIHFVEPIDILYEAFSVLFAGGDPGQFSELFDPRCLGQQELVTASEAI